MELNLCQLVNRLAASREDTRDTGFAKPLFSAEDFTREGTIQDIFVSSGCGGGC
ncbi:MAG: hypothetical protein HY319_04460 [Armatimonadetes bacterium]|nr:hypothetical protein [Armatimonadota bacterium]